MISTRTYYTRVLNRYLTNFIGYVFVFTIGSVDLIVAVGTTSTSFFSYDKFKKYNMFYHN